MYPGDSVRHGKPHFHVYYGSDEASYGIDPVEMIAGELAIRQQRFVEEWAELHQQELLENWRRLEEFQHPESIEPLD